MLCGFRPDSQEPDLSVQVLDVRVGFDVYPSYRLAALFRQVLEAPDAKIRAMLYAACNAAVEGGAHRLEQLRVLVEAAHMCGLTDAPQGWRTEAEAIAISALMTKKAAR